MLASSKTKTDWQRWELLLNEFLRQGSPGWIRRSKNCSIHTWQRWVWRRHLPNL